MSNKKVFSIPYLGIDHYPDYDLLYGENGEFSVVVELQNPVQQYSGSASGYDDFHNLFVNIIKILGDGFLLQKQDILSKSPYPYIPAEEYLKDKYNAHFAGREQLKISTYLTITRMVKRGAFYVYDPKLLRDFKQALGKIIGVLHAARTCPMVLREKQINNLVKRVLAMDFKSGTISLNNICPEDTQLSMGNLKLRNISLIDIDSIDLPSEISTHGELNIGETVRNFPVDLLSFLLNVPGYETLIYNQVIEIPVQSVTLNKLTLKRKRHSGIPDPANLLCVEDIDLLLKDVAKDNQPLVNAHFNILVSAKEENLQGTTNFIEGALFQLGIIPSKNAYNQLELFRTVLPGNGVELKPYDWFLTTCDAALCFLFKESLQKDEDSDFLVRFTDRRGIPVAIDPSDLPMRTNRISARNRFVIGPSGTGKSFVMSALLEQYMQYNMDIVIIDTGHSYSGLCSYYNGKYITYTDTKPITMNPFAISEEEYNIEKKDFLCTLVSLLWKGADGSVSTVERDLIANVISAYYQSYFHGVFLSGEEDSVDTLDFNSFYKYALYKIPKIKAEEQIQFDLEEFRFVLKKFYKGGEFDAILNEAVDGSLFTERFIVFEIDNLKNNKVLFPITTLIIMDVFIQKMRFRTSQRKCLVVEEAWKAIASPLMADYLLYLYKTVRKFWGEAIVVTQELADIIGNPVVKDSIISNSDTTILLDQRKFKDKYEEIAALLSIPETEQKKIFTINQLDNKQGRSRFNEAYIRRGAVGEVYGIETSIYQYLTFTTEKPEKSAVEIYVNAYGSYPAGLDAFVDDMGRSGLELGAFVTSVNQKGLQTVKI